MPTSILAQATVTGEAGYAQTIETHSHRLTSDEPERRGGTNTGPAPFELLLGSVGACTSITLRMYSERKQWNLGTIEVALRLLQTDQEPMRIERTISVSGTLDADQQAKLMEIADKTPVTKVVAPGVPIQTILTRASERTGTSTQPAR